MDEAPKKKPLRCRLNHHKWHVVNRPKRIAICLLCDLHGWHRSLR